MEAPEKPEEEAVRTRQCRRPNCRHHGPLNARDGEVEQGRRPHRHGHSRTAHRRRHRRLIRVVRSIVSGTTAAAVHLLKNHTGMVMFVGATILGGFVALSAVQDVPMLPEALQVVGLASIAYHAGAWAPLPDKEPRMGIKNGATEGAP